MKPYDRSRKPKDADYRVPRLKHRMYSGLGKVFLELRQFELSSKIVSGARGYTLSQIARAFWQDDAASRAFEDAQKIFQDDGGR